MALWSQNPIFLWLFPLVLDVGDSIVVWYNIQLNCTACRPYFLLDIMFDRKYFQKSHRKVLMMSQRNKASQYKWLFHLSDAKTFWKMYTLAQFSRKSYLCCGRYNMLNFGLCGILKQIQRKIDTGGVSTDIPELQTKTLISLFSIYLRWLTGGSGYYGDECGEFICFLINYGGDVIVQVLGSNLVMWILFNIFLSNEET